MAAGDQAVGGVYALTNSPAGNAVIAYDRSADGSLAPAGSYATGGLGDGAGLGSQGAVIVSDDGRLLFAVNPGSNSVSSFAIDSDGLSLVDTAWSGGSRPTSITHHGNLVYVLNAGSPNSISGFAVDGRGNLEPLAGSTRPLSGTQTAPAQVAFTPTGDALVVTERATNAITTYAVGGDGLASQPSSYPSLGVTPFGFAFGHRGHLVVSDAGGQSGASSYSVAGSGFVTAITGLAPTGQRAACWAVVTGNGRFAYVTNAATGNVSGFAVGSDGSLSLLAPDGVSATIGGNPTDAALSLNSRYLYVRNGNQNAINAFAIAADGSLSALPGIAGLPAGAAGLAAR
jgi:6-phosphogluconolactonase (cycloisomerase 2 family)